MEQLGEIGQRVEANVKPENIQHSTLNAQCNTKAAGCAGQKITLAFSVFPLAFLDRCVWTR
jgi:hypothetical protein